MVPTIRYRWWSNNSQLVVRRRSALGCQSPTAREGVLVLQDPAAWQESVHVTGAISTSGAGSGTLDCSSIAAARPPVRPPGAAPPPRPGPRRRRPAPGAARRAAERRQVQEKAGRILPGTHDLDPPTAEDLHATERRPRRLVPTVGSGGCTPRRCQTRRRYGVPLILVMEIVAILLPRHLSPHLGDRLLTRRHFVSLPPRRGHRPVPYRCGLWPVARTPQRTADLLPPRHQQHQRALRRGRWCPGARLVRLGQRPLQRVRPRPPRHRGVRRAVGRCGPPDRRARDKDSTHRTMSVLFHRRRWGTRCTPAPSAFSRHSLRRPMPGYSGHRPAATAPLRRR